MDLLMNQIHGSNAFQVSYFFTLLICSSHPTTNYKFSLKVLPSRAWFTSLVCFIAMYSWLCGFFVHNTFVHKEKNNHLYLNFKYQYKEYCSTYFLNSEICNKMRKSRIYIQFRGCQRCNFELQSSLNCLNLKWQVVDQLG